MDAALDPSFNEQFPPLFSVSFPSTSIDASALIPALFALIFIIWLLYTLVSTYHWLRYGHRSWAAVPALGIHVFISGSLMLYMMSGLR